MEGPFPPGMQGPHGHHLHHLLLSCHPQSASLTDSGCLGLGNTGICHMLTQRYSPNYFHQIEPEFLEVHIPIRPVLCIREHNIGSSCWVSLVTLGIVLLITLL